MSVISLPLISWHYFRTQCIFAYFEDGAVVIRIFDSGKYFPCHRVLADSQSTDWAASIQEHAAGTSSDKFAFYRKSVELWCWREPSRSYSKVCLDLLYLIALRVFQVLYSYHCWFRKLYYGGVTLHWTTTDEIQLNATRNRAKNGPECHVTRHEFVTQLLLWIEDYESALDVLTLI